MTPPLRTHISDVKSGDTSNRESLAARIYFDQLLDDATRRKPIWHNAALNYGYAMVRSHIARHIAARGLVASQGIFHHNELNSFNLADDLIEPYRAAVDLYILEKVAPLHVGDRDTSLTKHDRELIIDILNYYVIIDGKKFTAAPTPNCNNLGVAASRSCYHTSRSYYHASQNQRF